MLRTKRLILRPLKAEDADWITRDIVDPDVHRWLTAVPRPYSRQDAEWFIERCADEPWALVIACDGAPCGVLTILAERLDGAFEIAMPELGYWLAKHAWGQGIMTEAATALMSAYFAANSGVVGSGWIKGNTASERVLTKLGFFRTGDVFDRPSRFHGHDVPVVRVSLEAADWRAPA